MSSNKLGIIIPARYDSGRLPGKPLINFLGKSMIQRTWERCVMALEPSSVFIATDSEQIADHVSSFDANFIMTSSSCLTGTDRLAEANEELNFDTVINVQGDEPIIQPSDILSVIEHAKLHPEAVINAYAKIEGEEEYRSRTIPKVAKTLDGDLLYMSRSPIPGNKLDNYSFALKQICIYAFPKEALRLFSENKTKTPFEESEDIEILRFLEHSVPVKMIEVSGSSMAVDVDEDVIKVRKIIQNLESI